MKDSDNKSAKTIPVKDREYIAAKNIPVKGRNHMAAKTTPCRKKIMSLQRILLPRNRDSIEVLWPVQGYVEVTRGVVFKPPFSPC